jgi:hypothetical protein
MTGPTVRRIRGAVALAVGVLALGFAGYIVAAPDAFERPTLVAILLVVTAAVALWQAKGLLRGR